MQQLQQFHTTLYTLAARRVVTSSGISLQAVMQGQELIGNSSDKLHLHPYKSVILLICAFLHILRNFGLPWYRNFMCYACFTNVIYVCVMNERAVFVLVYMVILHLSILPHRVAKYKNGGNKPSDRQTRITWAPHRNDEIRSLANNAWWWPSGFKHVARLSGLKL